MAKKKIKVWIDDNDVTVEVGENLGFVHSLGCYAKAVKYKGKEYMVIKDGNGWRTRNVREKL